MAGMTPEEAYILAYKKAIGEGSGTVSSVNGKTGTVVLEYDDLENKPTIPDAQIQSDWEQDDNTKVDYIKNKPTIPSVDDELSPTSENPLQNKAIYNLLQDLLPEETAEGNPISISDASGLSAKSCEVRF